MDSAKLLNWNKEKEQIEGYKEGPGQKYNMNLHKMFGENKSSVHQFLPNQIKIVLLTYAIE